MFIHTFYLYMRVKRSNYSISSDMAAVFHFHCLQRSVHHYVRVCTRKEGTMFTSVNKNQYNIIKTF